MVCKMAKKGLVGLALAAGGLYLAFGTHAPSYVRTAFHKVRHNVKDSVPVQFEIDRAKQEIADLEPAILENREILARAEVDVEDLQKQISQTEKNLAAEKQAMVALRDKLATGDLKLAKNSNIRLTENEVKSDLAYKLDRYKLGQRLLEEKQVTLKAKQKAVESARAKLSDMANQKRMLAVKLEQIQAQLQAIEATQDKNEFTFDDTALSRAKETVNELEKRLAVKARVAEMEGRIPTNAMPVDIEGRDVLKEFDSEFGAPAEAPKAGGEKKSL